MTLSDAYWYIISPETTFSSGIRSNYGENAIGFLVAPLVIYCLITALSFILIISDFSKSDSKQRVKVRFYIQLFIYTPIFFFTAQLCGWYSIFTGLVMYIVALVALYNDDLDYYNVWRCYYRDKSTYRHQKSEKDKKFQNYRKNG